jgi:hypothetical protein
MPKMSSPREGAPSSVTFVSVPFPVSSAGRQRHKTFFESRIRRSCPPTPRYRGVATVPLLFFVPALTTTVAAFVLRPMR